MDHYPLITEHLNTKATPILRQGLQTFDIFMHQPVSIVRIFAFVSDRLRSPVSRHYSTVTNMNRTCKLNSLTEPVTISLSASLFLSSGGTFALYDANDVQLETWKMHVDESGSVHHKLTTSTDKLPGCFLTWDVSSCSQKAEVTSGTITITADQARPCAVEPPAAYPLDPVAQCSTGDYTKVTDQWEFAA